MTTDRDNIICLAREAGAPDWWVGLAADGSLSGPAHGWLSRFATLVIADFLQRTGQYVTNDATRAAVAERATEEANRKANASWKLMCEKMVAAEREACAQLVDPTAEHRAEPSGYLGGHEGVDLLEGIASRIRARSTP